MIETKYFILKPSGNTDAAYASRAALEAYANIIRPTNPALADALTTWRLQCLANILLEISDE